MKFLTVSILIKFVFTIFIYSVLKPITDSKPCRTCCLMWFLPWMATSTAVVSGVNATQE